MATKNKKSTTRFRVAVDYNIRFVVDVDGVATAEEALASTHRRCSDMLKEHVNQRLGKGDEPNLKVWEVQS